MKVVDDAIVALYEGASAEAVALRAITNGIWRAEDPDRPNVPFIRYSEISADTSRIFSGDQMEDTTYQLSIFSESHDATEIESIWAAMIALFDDAGLTVSGYDHIAMLRDSHGGPEVDAGQYHYWARYQILTDE
jgi:hypothetical protein